MPATVVRIASIVFPGVTIAFVALLFLWPEPEPVTVADRIEYPPALLFERPPLTDEVTFDTRPEAERRRQRLQRFVFGRPGLPRALPKVEQAIEDDEFADGLANLERIDRLTIALPLGFTSVAYHVLPERANGGLLIYQNGHAQDFVDGKTTVAYFLERGWTLLVFAMPYAGFNTNPETKDTPCGRVELAFAGRSTEHDTLACVPRPLRYFLEPVAVGLNYASTLGYQRTVMVGLSGGGWTTVAYSALDPRIQRSYPVAGSRPLHISARTCPGKTPETVARCFGDLEHRLPGLYRIANYLELYTLGATGAGRSQLAIYNVYDSCCFTGRSYEDWRRQVQGAVRRLGCGAYDAVGDTTHREHIVSEWALRVIESDLERRPPPCA
jgi:hypothetical protein